MQVIASNGRGASPGPRWFEVAMGGREWVVSGSIAVGVTVIEVGKIQDFQRKTPVVKCHLTLDLSRCAIALRCCYQRLNPMVCLSRRP